MNWSSIQQYCRRTVSRMTSDQQSADAAVMHKISTAVMGLSSSSKQVEAALALGDLAWEGPANSKLIVECQGSIAGLVQLLSSNSEQVQEAAASALRNLAWEVPADRKLIVEFQGSLAGLVKLLSSSSEQVQLAAAGALRALAAGAPANQQLIGECQGSIAGLVQLLSSSSEWVQEAAAAALRNLAAGVAANRKLIGECQGSIAGLVQLLSSSSEQVQEAAAAALGNLAYDVPANQQLIGECQGSIAGLVQLLSSSSTAVQQQAAWALNNLCVDCPANKECIGKWSGAVAALVALLGSSSEQVQETAAWALKSLAAWAPANKKLIGECQGSIAGLVKLLSSSSEQVQEAAAWALNNLCVGCPANQECIGKWPGAVAALVALLGSSSEQVQEAAAGALWNLANAAPANQQLIGECQGSIAGLVQLLSSSSEQVQEAAAGALRNLAAGAPANQQLIGECQGSIAGLVQLLSSSSSTAVQQQAAWALHNLCANCTANLECIGKWPGGVAALVALLGSSSEQVQEAANSVLTLLQLLGDSNTDPQQQVAQAGGSASSTASGDAPLHASAGAHLATTGVTRGVAALQASSPNKVTTHAVVVTAGTSPGSNAQAAAAIGGAALQAAAGIGHFIPVFGPLITGALLMAAQLLGMVHQAGLNSAKAGILAGRAQLIQGVLQDLNTKAQAPGLQVSKSDKANIIKALQQVQTALQAAQALLGRWVVPNKKRWYHQLERFAASKLDGQDLIEVDQELCVSYNQLASVLCTCGLFQLQLSASRAEAALAACQQDIANFEQNLIQLAGGVAQVQDELQQHRQDMQHVLPQLRAMGVQLLQLDGFLAKMDRLAEGISGLDQRVEEVLRFVRQKVSAPKPDMLILPSSIKLLGGSLGEGGFGAVHLARYGGEEVAVKVFFLQGATDEDMTKVYREAVLLSRLQHHPNIIRFYGLITDPHQGLNESRSHFNMGRSAAAPDLHGSLVMEKCDMDLHRLLQDDTIKLTLLDKVNIGLNIACGMFYLHHDCGSLAPVIHGDLKPSNVLVNLGGDRKPRQVKVCDFGISRTCQVSSTLYIKTTGKYHSFGSPQWMAPEVCQQLVSKSKGSKQPMTKEVDVYAFGILLFEVVTQRQPFDDEDIPMLCVRVIHGLRPEAREWLEQEVQEGDTSSESGVLQRLVTLMESCWSSDPSARPSFKAIVCQLQEMAEQLEARGLK